MIRIRRTNSNFEREPLIAPFGFKGGYLSEIWQSVALLESDTGRKGIGLGTQSTLWSDADVFARSSEAAGNSMMYLLTAHALESAQGLEFSDPLDLLDQLLPEAYEFGKRVTGKSDLRLTFALNALVAVDNAAWQLYCAENGIASFDEMIPREFAAAFTHRHAKLACIPLMSYGVPVEEIRRSAEAGFCLLKIKIGSDPDHDGDQDKMLAWDIQRIGSIHAAVKDVQSPCTQSGQVLYYLDANGRYDSRERLLRLVDAIEDIGALDRVVLLEEPFPEELEVDVGDLPVRIAADESAHSEKDAGRRIDMGYGAIALKPIAKTTSESLRVARLAHKRGIPCFCADLTVNPILVDWNKNVAARLAPLPGLEIGALETNGHQNYRDWETMETYHPRHGAGWTRIENGVFRLGEEFYESSGGILETSAHYAGLVDPGQA